MSDLQLFGLLFLMFSAMLVPLFVMTQRKRRQERLAAQGGGYDAPASYQAAAAPLASAHPPRRAAPPTPAARVVPAVTPETVPVAPTAASAHELAQPVRALRLEQTLQVLNDSLHLMLVGETNAGKSTAAEAVLASRVESGDQVVILDPHAEPSAWRGVPAVGLGRDYDAIAAAMDGLLAEMTDRYQRRAAGDVGYPPVTVFIDEWPAIQTHCKQAGSWMAQMAQEARKVAMRLVILTQSDRVESLGLSGKGDVRENFVMLLLGNKATAALPETARMSRPAAVRKGAQLLPATVDGLHLVAADFALRPGVMYGVSASAATAGNADGGAPGFDLDAELARFLQLAPPADPGLELINGTGDTAPGVAEKQPAVTGDAGDTALVLPDTNAVSTSSAPLPQDELSVGIRALVTAGWSRNKIVEMLRIPGQRVAQLRRIKVALGEISDEAKGLQEPAAPVGAV